ncbi:MAG: helix-turn-helix transcriptional regulator [Clostridia bacterium]|nr:helix-turn-helix transcriptional regulator [Clostridia bacterium]
MIQIGKIVNFGVYDSEEFYPKAKQSKVRKARYFEFEYCIGNGGKTVTNGVAYERKADTVFLRKPNSVGYSQLPFKCYFFHLEMEESSPYYKELCALPDCYNVFDYKEYLDLFSELVSHLTLVNGKHDELVFARLLEIIYCLKRDASPNYYALAHGQSRNCSLSSALSYINVNFQRKITLNELASVAGYSPQHLLFVFSQTFGQTPCEYIIKKRLELSCEKLSNTSDDISKIAQDCGFSSQSYFTKQFKKEYSLTPAKYRKRSWQGYVL